MAFRWPWSQRSEPVATPQPRERGYWEDWTPWIYQPPPRSALVIAMRREWEAPQIFRPCDQSAEFNIANLYWKPWSGVTIDSLPMQ